MAVVVQGTPSVYESASATSAVIPYPSGIVAGELLLAQVAHTQSPAPVTNPGGWTLIDSKDGEGGGPGIAVWAKIATGSESGSVTFATSGTAGRVTGLMQRWTGQAGTYLDVTPVKSGSGIAVGYTSPSMDTITNNVTVFHVVALNASTTSDINTPSGLTKVSGSGTTGRKLSVFVENQGVAGSTGTQTWSQTSTTALQWTSITVGLRPSDTTVTPPPSGVTPGLVQRVVGIPAVDPATTGQVNVKVNNAVSVRLRCSTDASGTTGVVFGPAATPSTRGDARLTISGLSPSTRYYYRVMMTNSSGSEFADNLTPIGRLKTAPNGPASFSFTFASCNSGNHTAASTAMANRNDDLSFHLGDLYYHDGSGTGLDNFRNRMNAAMTSQVNLFATTNMHILPSDHDGMNNDGAAGSDPTAWNNWNIARSELFPNPQNYFAFNWGRVRFIMLDTRSYKSNPGNTDNSSKTALGSTQKQWLKDQITALPADNIAIIGQDTPWITGTSAGDDAWGGFLTERNELASHFSASGKKIIMLGGDMHALAAEDGSGSPGGVPVFQAAPFNQAASHKGGPWDVGPYPAAGPTVQQYGRVTINDTGNQIQVVFKGYSADNTERISMTKTYAVTPAPVSGTTVRAHSMTLGVQASGTTVRTHRVQVGVATSSGIAGVRVHRTAITATGFADPGPNVSNLEAGLLVQMDANAEGAVLSYTWDQVSGPTVTLTPSGTGGVSCSYTTPYLEADADLVFRVVANYADGVKSGEGITRHSIVRAGNQTATSDNGMTPVVIHPVLTPVVTPPPTEEPPPPPPPPSGYQPVGATGNWSLKWADDFNTLNRTLWTPYWFVEGGQMNNVATVSSNVAIENGELTLRLSNSSTGALMSTNPRDGVAGHTGFEFNYGFVEARIFFPGNGATVYNWPAWWTTGHAWPGTGENDIAEVTGWDGVNSMTSNHHYSANGVHASKGSGTIPGNWGGGWHTYGLHRAPGQNKVYYDGQLVYSYIPEDNGSPHYLLLNIGASVGNSLVGDASKVRVDYVRFWEDATVPAPGGNPSGVAVPSTNLPGWNLVLSEDFTENAALGQFPAVYGPIWSAADGQHDTSRAYGRPLANEGIYDSTKTVTVHNSMLDIHVYTDPATGRPWVANPIPDTGTWGQLYGRYAVRFKADTVQGFKIAWLLWPTSENWNQGEIDFPEAGLGNNIQGYSHNVFGSPNTNQWIVNTNVNMAQWHTAVIEWTPTSLKFILDDTVYTTTDSAAIPTNPMYWKLQTETNLSATPPPTSAQGHVYIDWVAVWTRA